jgi:2-polyprenyl-3-methyl-5-hydroxy-6-metoxy-1,4-benzoquinol methylase
VVSSWEKKEKRGDIPVSKEIWDSQYSNGKWNFLGHLDQLARYSVVAGYLQYLKPGGSILDVGCGDGILLERLSPTGYSKYLGIDISEAAIDKAVQKQNEQAAFITGDAEKYVPIESFDVVVFNESLYYFNDPLDVVGKYIKALKEDGIFIISTYLGSERALSILGGVKSAYFSLVEVKITHKAKSWICTIFSPFRKNISSN